MAIVSLDTADAVRVIIDAKVRRACPSCRMLKPLALFGFRRCKTATGIEVRNQSWCTQCRSTKAKS